MDSSRTSGGISKSLLTPIRRLGLTKRRRNPGSSPLSLETPSPVTSSASSPISAVSTTPNIKQSEINNTSQCDANTPVRKLGLHRRQQNKISRYALTKCNKNESREETEIKENTEDGKSDSIDEDVSLLDSDTIKNNLKCEVLIEKNIIVNKTLTKLPVTPEKDEVEHLTRRKNSLQKTPKCNLASLTKHKSKDNTPKLRKTNSGNSEDGSGIASKLDQMQTISTTIKTHTSTHEDDKIELVTCNKSNEKQHENVVANPNKIKSKEQIAKLKKRKSSDLNLKKKCIVVIDNHILKKNVKHSVGSEHKIKSQMNMNTRDGRKSSSSDMDDIPLSEITEKLNIKSSQSSHKRVIVDSDDDDFCKKTSQTENNSPGEAANPVKIKSSIPSNKKQKTCAVAIFAPPTKKTKVSSDSDDDFDCKKTILIRKSYPKPVHKAKSTGSITQKDIDDIKTRIQMKRNTLLIKNKGHNIEELMDLIKKWRKGCQEALMELLDIMKRRIPEKQNMKTPELLKMLNIPIELVDYDVEDDCFVSPE